MKAIKTSRLISLLLSLVMVFSMIYISSSSAYAESEVTWPQIEKLDMEQSTIEWISVVDSFSSEYKGYFIDNYSELIEHPSSTESKKRYYAGTIYLYFDKLPTAEERLDSTAGINFTPKGTEENNYINWHSTSPASSNYNRFDNKQVTVCWAYGNNEYSTENDTSVTTRCLEDSNKTRYIYNIKLVEIGTPQVEKLDMKQSTIEWISVVDSFSSEFKGYRIENYSNPLEHPHPSSTESKKRYYAGTIYLYFDKLPTAEERLDSTAGINFTPKGTEENGYINWRGTSPASSNYNRFDNKQVTVCWAYGNNEYSTENDTSVTTRCLEDSNKTRYIYNIKLVEYTEPGSTFELISDVEPERINLQSANISFSSNYDGTFYYAVFDSHQDNPAIDTSSSGTSLIAGNNIFAIENLSGYDKKYVYVKGFNGSDYSNVLEFVIPGYALNLNHEIQALDGFCVIGSNGVIGGDFYTERFEDNSGNIITKAIPGETVKVVFGANGGRIQNPITQTVGNQIVGLTKSYQIIDWTINGITLDNTPTQNDTEFSFVMPENDVTIQANMSLVGSPIKFSSTRPISEGLYMRWDYYRSDEIMTGWDSELNYVIPQGGQEFESVFKNGLTFRANSIFKPGFEMDGYVLDHIEIWNNGENLKPSDVILYETGFTLAEGDNYEFKFVFRDKAFASVTAVPSDSSMGTASASVESGSLELVFEGQTVTLTAVPEDGYFLDKWNVTVKDHDDITITVTPDQTDVNKATFVVPAMSVTDVEIVATAEFEPEAAINIAQTSLTLNGDIGVNFYLTIPEDIVENAYVCINFRGETTKYKVSEFTPADGKYKFTAKTYATEMRAPIVLTVEDASGNKIRLLNSNGTIDYTENGYTYSIERYFTLAREQYTAYPKVIALVNAMDEYGKYAQNFFNHTSLEVGDVSDVTLAVLEQYKMVRTDMPTGLEYGGTTLVLDSTTAYRHYFKAASGHSLDEFTFTIDGVTQTLKEKDGKYYIEVSDIRADKLNEFKTLVISNGTSETYSIKYCALSYARTAVNQNLEMANVTRALYKYFVAADAYF